MYHYLDFLYYRSLLHYQKLFKKLGKNKNKLRNIYPTNHENVKYSRSGVQFYRFLQKRVLCKQSEKSYLLFRNDETVIGRRDDGYQIYSFHFEQALVGYYLPGLNEV